MDTAVFDLLPAGTKVHEALWLRSPSSSGGKDWIGCLTDRGVFTLWGKTGQVNQSSAPKRTSHDLLSALLNKKRAKGYTVIGRFVNGQWFPSFPMGSESIQSFQPPPRRRVRPSQVDRTITVWVENQQEAMQPWF